MRLPSAGAKKSAKERLAARVAIRVSGRYFMNSPTMPGQNNSGENAAMRVTVAPITGPVMRVAGAEDLAAVLRDGGMP